ncbi:MAG: DUF421 domain-containing protein [Actinomycetota bacterium]|nr:DUF421 domain-containing protein [Actinomycetota bacterium]
MWTDLTQLGISVPDKLIRTLAVYIVLAVLLRLAGKRDLAQLNTFDLVVMLLLSNVVQNAVIGPDNSLLGGVIGATALIAINSALVRTSRRSDWLAMLVEGTPTTLAKSGHWDNKALAREGLRKSDVDAALRRQNANGIQDVDEVRIEPGGAIVATLRAGQQAATREDIMRVESKLDRLLAQ